MKIGFRLVGALLSLVGTQALAQTTAPALYLDLDANPATGCSVATDAGAVSGVEVRLRGSVGGEPLAVQTVDRASCTGGTFAAEQSQPAGYAVGIDVGTDGADVIELSTPLDGLGDGGSATAYFVVGGAGGGAELVQAAIVLPGVEEPGPAAQPAIIPTTGGIAILLLVGFTLWAVRRHPAFGSTLAVVLLMGSGIAWAASFIADGQIVDWTGVAPVATDPPNGGSDGSSDLLAVFAATENGRLHIRFDVRDLDAETPDNEAPTLADATFTLDENSAAGTAVGSMTATDPDAGQSLAYAIAAGNTGNTFAIDASTGAITVADAAALDAETTTSFSLSITVTDDGDPALSDTATATITVNDVNEAPQLGDEAFVIAENAAVGSPVGTVAASDPDATAPNATLAYAITAGNTGNAFAIDATTGAITVADGTQVTLANAPFALAVQASDGGTPALQDSATVTIDISDENDAPAFGQAAYTFSVDENSAANTSVGTVAATDADAGDVLAYSITGGNTGNAFAVDAATGAIVVATPPMLDAETAPAFTLTVAVNDDGTPSLADTATVTVSVADINEAPTLADATFTLVENSAPGTAVGSVVATDPDATAPANTLAFAITAGNDDGAFAIDAGTGAISVASSTPLDFEGGGSFSLSVSVTDGGGLDDTAQTAIVLTDANEAPTLADTSRTVLQDSAAGTPVGAPLAATDPDATAPNNTLAYSIASGNTGNAFAIDGSSGQLSVATASQITAGASFALVVAATDGGGLSDSATVAVDITDVNDAPSFTPGPSQIVLEDTGPQSGPWATAIDDNDPGTQLLTFVVTNDAPALFATAPTIDAGGVLSYQTTPDANGSATVTVVLHDDGGTVNGGVDASAPQTFTIMVTSVNDAPSFAASGDQTVAEDAPPQAISGWATAISPGPADEAGQAVTFVATSDNPALFQAQVAVTAGGTLTFTPAANASGVATVTVTAMDDGGIDDGGEDTSAAEVFTITLIAADDAPVAVADAFTAIEDSGANAFAVLANDTDADGGPISVASVTQPANGAVVVTGGGTGLTYQPNTNYCNTPPGTAPDTFTYTLTPGGSSTTVSVAVTCVDDAPMAVADNGVVAQDAGATAIDVLANDTDVDGGPTSVTSITQPANGNVAITGGGTGLTYQPNAGYCNTPPGTAPDTFTYTLAPGGSSATVSVAVTCPMIVTITSNGAGDTAAINFPGGSTIAVTDVDATAPVGNPAIVFSLAGGADQAHFTINAGTGVLGFVTPPLVETPTDADADNVYDVIVRASSDVLEDTQALSVTVVPGLAVRAKYVVIMRSNETTNLDVRVLDANGDVEPGAPYDIAYAPGAITIDPTGQITPIGANQSSTQVTITSPGHAPWVAWVAVRSILGVTSPHVSSQSISGSDDFSALRSPAGTPSNSYYGDIYRIVLPAGDLEVTMDTGDDLDSYLLLANAEGFVVAGNDDDDDGVLGVGSRMRYTVTEPGVYFIEASTFNGLDTGNYTFAVNHTPAEIDVGAYALNGSCGILGVQGPGFTLTAGAEPLPVGTQVITTASGVANSGVWSVTGGTANVSVLSSTARLIVLTAPLPAGATIQFRTTLSISVAFTLNGATTLPAGYVGTGSKPNGSVSSTLILCSAT